MEYWFVAKNLSNFENYDTKKFEITSILTKEGDKFEKGVTAMKKGQTIFKFSLLKKPFYKYDKKKPTLNSGINVEDGTFCKKDNRGA